MANISCNIFREVLIFNLKFEIFDLIQYNLSDNKIRAGDETNSDFRRIAKILT